MIVRKILSDKIIAGIPVVVLAAMILSFNLQELQSVPYFARKYDMTCKSCHSMPPVLNQNGENFLANGYRFDGDVKTNGTWPFALWLTERGEARHSDDLDKAFPNKVELISGGQIGNTKASYFLEWRILSQQLNSDGSLKDRSGRFEDLFVSYNFSTSVNIKVGQYRLLNQIDDSRKLGLSTPLVLGAKIPGIGGGNARGRSLRAFAPNGRSPSVSIQHQSMQGEQAADGLFNIVSLAFPGEFSLPLSDEAQDEASLEFDSEPKGVFFESFHRKDLSSVGAYFFAGDRRSMGSLIGVYNNGSWLSKAGLGYVHANGRTKTIMTAEADYILHDYLSGGVRLDHQNKTKNGTSFVSNVNVQWPLSEWTLRLALEHRVQSDNNVTLGELSLVF